MVDYFQSHCPGSNSTIEADGASDRHVYASAERARSRPVGNGECTEWDPPARATRTRDIQEEDSGLRLAQQRADGEEEIIRVLPPGYTAI